MPRRGVRCTVLCEDRDQEQFVRWVLRTLGINTHDIRLLPIPAGSGAGDAWVLDRYPDEVRALRHRFGSQKNVGLIVVIDADRFTGAQRRRQFDDRLTDRDRKKRDPREQIVIRIPKRHIETWLAWLDAQNVNESQDCKRLARDVSPRSAAARFVELFRARSTDAHNLLPAVADAFDELERVPL